MLRYRFKEDVSNIEYREDFQELGLTPKVLVELMPSPAPLEELTKEEIANLDKLSLVFDQEPQTENLFFMVILNENGKFGVEPFDNYLEAEFFFKECLNEFYGKEALAHFNSPESKRHLKNIVKRLRKEYNYFI